MQCWYHTEKGIAQGNVEKTYKCPSQSLLQGVSFYPAKKRKIPFPFPLSLKDQSNEVLGISGTPVVCLHSEHVLEMHV